LAAAHDCVHALENVARHAEDACIAIEQHKDLSPDAIRRGRVEICEKALARLADFNPLESAEKALSGGIRALESLENRTPDQVKALQQYKQAVGDLREGLDATRRTILEICKLRAGAPV
jgi:hypothetical protein